MARVIMVNSVPRIRSELSIHGANSITRTARQAGVMAFRGSVAAPEIPNFDATAEVTELPPEEGLEGVIDLDERRKGRHELEMPALEALGELGVDHAEAELELVDSATR